MMLLIAEAFALAPQNVMQQKPMLQHIECPPVNVTLMSHALHILVYTHTHIYTHAHTVLSLSLSLSLCVCAFVFGGWSGMVGGQ